MNAPTTPNHLLPAVAQREVPEAMIQRLKAQFGERCSTAMAVREQHGRDESSFEVPPPAAVTFTTVVPPLQSMIPETEAELRGLFARDLHTQIVRVVVEPGEPAELIPQTACAIRADLLVLGLPYKTRFGGDFAIGRTVPYVLKNAPCQVWICREPPKGGD